MTQNEGDMLWSRMLTIFDEPRSSGEASADLYAEWWSSIRSLDYRLANGAVTSMKNEREYKSFPTVGEFKRYYRSESGPRSTVDDGQAVNYTERYYQMAIRLPDAEYAELKDRAKVSANQWCQDNNMIGFEGLRAIFEIARAYAEDRNLRWWPGVQEDDVPF